MTFISNWATRCFNCWYSTNYFELMHSISSSLFFKWFLLLGYFVGLFERRFHATLTPFDWNQQTDHFFKFFKWQAFFQVDLEVGIKSTITSLYWYRGLWGEMMIRSWLRGIVSIFKKKDECRAIKFHAFGNLLFLVISNSDCNLIPSGPSTTAFR